MRAKGEITVFLSLVLVSVLSLLLGLLESARTAGARLYLQMAADSALSSVMGQYNRNLWDAYHLLFLEYESEQSIENAFQEYFDFYLQQENLYPMERRAVKITGLSHMGDHGAAALEQGIMACMKYRLPGAAAEAAGLVGEASEAARAGDFRGLLELCGQAGRKTRSLEKKRRAVDEAVEKMEEQKSRMLAAAEEQDERPFSAAAKKLRREMKAFSGKVKAYETEFNRFSEYGEKMDAEAGPEDAQAAELAEQEKTVFRQAVEAARQTLLDYQKQEQTVADSLERLEEILEYQESSAIGDQEDGTESGGVTEAETDDPDWDGIAGMLEELSLPESREEEDIDEETEASLDRLEELFSRSLLEELLPEGARVSEKQVSLKGIPSARLSGGESGRESTDSGVFGRFLIGEYVRTFFSSFHEKHGESILPEERALSYEQEYILCGKETDRENLEETVEALLAVRGAMNLLWLLSSPEKKTQADGLAASVSGGNLPLQVLISFLILSLWALGEAVWDLRILLDHGGVAFWKTETEWKTSLEGLLELEFLTGETGNKREKEGSDYEDHLRLLFFLEEASVRNYRLMDLIQWNVKAIQPDFAAKDCACEIEITAEAAQRHLFLLQSGYMGTVTAAGAY